MKVAYYYNDKTLELGTIIDGKRTIKKTLTVSGKREARKIAQAGGFKEWNF